MEEKEYENEPLDELKELIELRRLSRITLTYIKVLSTVLRDKNIRYVYHNDEVISFYSLKELNEQLDNTRIANLIKRSYSHMKDLYDIINEAIPDVKDKFYQNINESDKPYLDKVNSCLINLDETTIDGFVVIVKDFQLSEVKITKRIPESSTVITIDEILEKY